MLRKRGCVLGLQACGLGLGGCGLVNITAKTYMILKTDHYHSMSLVIITYVAVSPRSGRQAAGIFRSFQKVGVRPPPSKKWGVRTPSSHP